MKQFLSLLLALILCMSLCACGNSSETPEATPTPAPTAETTPTPTPTPEPKEDDKYLVNRTDGTERVGTYSGLVNGVPTELFAYVRIAEIQIINTINGEILAEHTFRGSEPPQGIFKEEDAIGDYPDEDEITAWVADTLDELKESANAAALEYVCSYLQSWDCSSAYMTEMLMEEGFSETEARYAIVNCGADWPQINLRIAQYLLQRFPYLSRDALIADLMDYNGMRKTEATAAANAIDWNEQALAAAYALLDDENGFGYSPDSLFSWLHNEYGFEEEQAQYALDNVETDWNVQAKNAAQFGMEYWDSFQEYYGDLCRESMIQCLTEWYNFTEEQAAYGAAAAGLK